MKHNILEVVEKHILKVLFEHNHFGRRSRTYFVVARSVTVEGSAFSSEPRLYLHKLSM